MTKRNRGPKKSPDLGMIGAIYGLDAAIPPTQPDVTRDSVVEDLLKDFPTPQQGIRRTPTGTTLRGLKKTIEDDKEDKLTS